MTPSRRGLKGICIYTWPCFRVSDLKPGFRAYPGKTELLRATRLNDLGSPLPMVIALIGVIQRDSMQVGLVQFPGLIIAANIAVNNTAPGIDGYPGNVATFPLVDLRSIDLLTALGRATAPEGIAQCMYIPARMYVHWAWHCLNRVL